MLVDERFREWTAGLDAQDALISVFEHIRDIPYSLAVPMTDQDSAPEQILSLGKGYCGPKHYLLSEMYRRMGYEVVYATFPFLWDDPDLRYPTELRQRANGLPVAHHLACRVRINNRWVLVDATWDLPLKRAGFPVNENWDGLADTLCAVKSLQSAMRTAFGRTATNKPYRNGRDMQLNPCDGEQDHWDADAHARFYRGKTGMRSADEIERIRRFNREFDMWLQEIRERP
jgi:transglutaminase-like putative cysteine protease